MQSEQVPILKKPTAGTASAEPCRLPADFTPQVFVVTEASHLGPSQIPPSPAYPPEPGNCPASRHQTPQKDTPAGEDCACAERWCVHPLPGPTQLLVGPHKPPSLVTGRHHFVHLSTCEPQPSPQHQPPLLWVYGKPQPPCTTPCGGVHAHTQGPHSGQ